MIIEEQWLARRVLVAPQIGESAPSALDLLCRILPSSLGFGVERGRPGLRSYRSHQRIVEAWRRGLRDQLILTDCFLDDRPQVARGRSRVAEISSPGVAGANQQPLGPGDRYVAQPVLGQE